MVDEATQSFDLVLVGGGLQSGLIALALRRRQPDLALCIVERDEVLAGNHTWCFHQDDVPPAEDDIAAELVVHSWPGYEVHFPRHSRELNSTYSMVSSTRLREQVQKAFGDDARCAILTGTAATLIAGDRVTLADGRVLRARLVIDARGPSKYQVETDKAGYQKFVGLEVRTEGEHGIDQPVLMDANVEQIDGFRFLYVLPLAPDRLLLEDTRFSNNANLDEEHIRGCIREYANERGIAIKQVEREEQGVLPLPWSGGPEVHVPGQPLRAGYGAGWCHPVTGYSFPIALRLAGYIAANPIDALARDGFSGVLAEHLRQLDFSFRLNKMLFRWFAPSNRFHVLERFYTLDEAIIRRFYALQSTGFDRARIFIGRPPRGMSYRAALFGGSAS